MRTRRVTPAQRYVKLITGVLSGDAGLFGGAARCLERKYGPVDMESSVMPFAETDYYEDELGKGLLRVFFSFRDLVPLEQAFVSKIVSGRVERKFSKDNRRRVNIDPGYVSAGKLVLFTTKDYSHRIHVARGIYAEVTLKFEKKEFQPWPWTYPDFKTAPYRRFFEKVRAEFMKQVTTPQRQKI
ncbi:MAG: DUF4416 family protein [Candidatus Omnitrophota bacterium]